MTVIDVDSHFEPGPAWLDSYPELVAELPVFDTAEVTTKILAGDILAGVPADEWPSFEELLPPGMAVILGEETVEGYGYEGSSMHATTSAKSRVAWLDQNGIDFESVICLEGMLTARFIDDRDVARRTIELCNDWLADAVSDHLDRLAPVTCLDFTDIDRSVRQMHRMRERGSRTFLVGTIPAPGIPIFHSSMEPIWSTAEELGMLALLHVGYNPASFNPAWANVEGNMMLLRQLGVSQGSQTVELMLNGMVFGGVFDRHPNLRLLVAECGIHWFNGMANNMQNRDHRTDPTAGIYMGKTPFELTPLEFIRRNVRVTPLPRRHQSPAELLTQFPECVVFSSDYAHNEGSGTPVAYYQELLADLDPALKARFFGGTIADDFTAMGNPLPVGASTSAPAT